MGNIKKIKGVVVPMITPFTAHGVIDTNAVQKIVRYHAKAGVSLFIMGTTGEGLSISNEERIGLAKAVVDEKENQQTIFAGISHHCVKDSVELAHRFFNMGVDIVSAHLPSYYPLTDSQVFNYYKQLADVVPGPLLLYNIPQTVSMSISLEVADELSHHKNICGIKDSERGLNRLKQALMLWKNRDDFCHLTGWAAQSAYALSMGSDGIVPGAANIVPHLYEQLYKAALERDKQKAQKLQKDADAISQIYQKNKIMSQSFAALKVMAKQYDLCDPFVLPPLTACTDNEQKEIMSKIASCQQLN